MYRQIDIYSRYVEIYFGMSNFMFIYDYEHIHVRMHRFVYRTLYDFCVCVDVNRCLESYAYADMCNLHLRINTCIHVYNIAK